MRVVVTPDTSRDRPGTTTAAATTIDSTAAPDPAPQIPLATRYGPSAIARRLRLSSPNRDTPDTQSRRHVTSRVTTPTSPRNRHRAWPRETHPSAVAGSAARQRTFRRRTSARQIHSTSLIFDTSANNGSRPRAPTTGAKCPYSTRLVKNPIRPAAIRSTPKRDLHTAILRASQRRPRQICCRETDLRIRWPTFSAVSHNMGTDRQQHNGRRLCCTWTRSSPCGPALKTR
jgi:hypothetical protein